MNHVTSRPQPRVEHELPLSPVPSGAPPREPRRSRKKTARAFLVAIFFLLRIPDAFLFVQTYNPVNPSPGFRGNLIIIAIWTTLFLGAVWFRQRWARYLLIAFVGYVAVLDGVMLCSVLLDQQGFQIGPMIGFAVQFVCYIAALAILIRSSSIRRLADRSRSPAALV